MCGELKESCLKDGLEKLSLWRMLLLYPILTPLPVTNHVPGVESSGAVLLASLINSSLSLPLSQLYFARVDGIQF